jgi:peptidoglycan/xylan/chitin deacetylase (PgdA/CDA1 family)
MSLIRIFAVIALVIASVALQAQTRTVAITIDDLPFVSGDNSKPLSPADAKWAAASNHKLLMGFARHHVPVVGLVNESGVESLGSPAGTKILREWTQRGFDLGNHTYSHPDFNDLTVAQFEDEIIRGEKTFTPLMNAVGRNPEFFRFPFNHTGDTREKHDAVAAFLKDHGYTTAPCTVENSDWLFNAAYFLAHSQHDPRSAARLRAEYVAFTSDQIDAFSRLNKNVLGYEPPQIMLLHDNPLNADVIDELLGLFEKKGYSFVSLAQAETDPVYHVQETFVTSYGPMWGYRWARERGVSVGSYLDPDPPQWIVNYGKKSTAKPRRARSQY